MSHIFIIKLIYQNDLLCCLSNSFAGLSRK